ncbi:hypothetical protein BVRB_001090 [Beta vulgaris subsp. vulgaris]|uniref:Uncharacterized protein n=1 Tax=Beta vulgaris subsp. vulgaris TaxID=3555 RepID=A0A0J8B4R4_BETVV|nr:hypothetical protein BVRB_001090 [Beta vulgaris subsp. vulgaris]
MRYDAWQEALDSLFFHLIKFRCNLFFYLFAACDDVHEDLQENFVCLCLSIVKKL